MMILDRKFTTVAGNGRVQKLLRLLPILTLDQVVILCHFILISVTWIEKSIKNIWSFKSFKVGIDCLDPEARLHVFFFFFNCVFSYQNI